MGLEVCGIFLDMSKAFDKVLHNRLIFILRQNGNCGEMINFLEGFLSERKPRIALNGLCLSWTDIRACVPQWSTLGYLLLFIYISTIYQMMLKVNANCLLMTHLCFL